MERNTETQRGNVETSATPQAIGETDKTTSSNHSESSRPIQHHATVEWYRDWRTYTTFLFYTLLVVGGYLLNTTQAQAQCQNECNAFVSKEYVNNPKFIDCVSDHPVYPFEGLKINMPVTNDTN